MSDYLNKSYLTILSIFIFDRLSKILIIKNHDTLNQTTVSVFSFLDLRLIWNDGIAFGLFSFDQSIYYNSLTLLIVLITIIIFWLMIKAKGLEKMGFSMIIGGSLGNLFDRIYYSSVPDFIDFHINNFHWFIFNVADIFISLGVLLLIFLEIFSKKKYMKNLFLIIFISILLTSCASSGDAFKLKKKSSGDEFLVEKKNPL